MSKLIHLPKLLQLSTFIFIDYQKKKKYPIKFVYLLLLGMEKINFSGGEPFLPSRGRHLGEMVKFCKEKLDLPSVSIVSNGSLITEKWFQEYGEYVDIMAISCDSFNEDTNKVDICYRDIINLENKFEFEF